MPLLNLIFNLFLPIPENFKNKLENPSIFSGSETIYYMRDMSVNEYPEWALARNVKS